MEKYFVTCDLESTIDKLGFNINLSGLDLALIRDGTRDSINSIFGKNSTKIITYDEIVSFFNSRKKDNEFIISLDNWIYSNDADFYFDCTRMYDDLKDIISWNYDIKTRTWDDIKTQISTLIKQLNLEWKNKKIVLCDDGIFSWDTLKKILELLKSSWIKPDLLRVILNFSRNTNLLWVEIEALRNEKSCIDWIDERDFYFWIPMWWASIFNSWNIYGVSYVSNCPIAEKKASIPKKYSKVFCEEMIDLNINLIKQIEKTRWKIIELIEMERSKQLLPQYGWNMPFSYVLNEEKKKI